MNTEILQDSHPTMVSEDTPHTPVNLGKKMFGVMLLAGSISALAFEQSPANEALRVNQAMEVIEDGGDPIDVGIKVGTITMAIELGSSALIVAGLNQEGGVMHRGLQASKARKERRDVARADRKRLKKQETGHAKVQIDDPIEDNYLFTKIESEPISSIKTEKNRRSKFANASAAILTYSGMALGVGAGIVVIDKNRQSKDTSLAKDSSHAVAASSLVAGTSGAIGYLAAGGIEHLDGTPFETPAEVFVDHATDLKTWAIVLSPILLFRAGRWLNDIRHERKMASHVISHNSQEIDTELSVN